MCEKSLNVKRRRREKAVKTDNNFASLHVHQQFTLESDVAQGDNFDGNSISRGGTEVLLGDLNLKADNR